MPILPTITAQPNPDHFGGARVKAKRRSYIATSGHVATLRIVIEDASGNPVDLGNYGFVQGGGSEPASTLRVAVRERVDGEGTDVTADVVDVSNGIITATLPEGITERPGIWLMLFSAILPTDEAHFLGDAYLVIEKGLSTVYSGPPSLAEIRMFLRDYAQENELLDAVDFDVSELAMAASMCVNEWNEIPPPDGQRYTTSDFPYRWNWLVGISSKLFRIAAEHYARNSLKFVSGGKTTDDKNRTSEYMQRAEMARQEWTSFIRERKTIDSVNAGGYGEVSGFFNYPW